MKPSQQSRVAYHEAGHAVVRVALGLEPCPVEIRTDGTGLAHGTERLEHGDRWIIERQILWTLAGPVAEARAARCSLISVFWGGGASDWAHARERLATPCPYLNDLDSYEQWARELVGEHWQGIERVAVALLERGRLDGSTVADLAGLDLPRRETLAACGSQPCRQD